MARHLLSGTESLTLDNPIVATLGARLVRYPVRDSHLAFHATGDEVAVRVESHAGRLEITANASGATPEPVAPRRLLVAPVGRAYEIPWTARYPPRSAARPRIVPSEPPVTA